MQTGPLEKRLLCRYVYVEQSTPASGLTAAADAKHPVNTAAVIDFADSADDAKQRASRTHTSQQFGRRPSNWLPADQLW